MLGLNLLFTVFLASLPHAVVACFAHICGFQASYVAFRLAVDRALWLPFCTQMLISSFIFCVAADSLARAVVAFLHTNASLKVRISCLC